MNFVSINYPTKTQMQYFAGGDLFFSYYNRIWNKKSSTINSQQLRGIITDGEWKNDQGQSVAYITAQARQCNTAGDEKGYDTWKGQLPVITPAALCNPEGGHGQANIANYTGLLMYDIDHLSSSEEARRIVQLAAQQPYTYVAHVTPSGHGARWLARYKFDETAEAILREKHGVVTITPQDYTTICKHVRPEIERIAGCTVDTATKDATRTSYLCHDPEAYFDLSPHTEKNSLIITPEVLNPLPPAKECAAQAAKLPFTTDPHERTLNYLESIGKNYVLHNRNNYLYAYACSMFRYGVSEAEVHQQAVQIAYDLSLKERTDTVNSAYRGVSQNRLFGDLKHLLDPSRQQSKRRSGKQQEKEKESAAQLDERVEEYIKSKYYFVRHTRTEIVQYCTLKEAKNPNPLMRPYKTLLPKSTLNDLKMEANKALGIRYNKKLLEDMLRSDAVCEPYDPITDFMTYCEHEVEKRYGKRRKKRWHTNPYYLDKNGNTIAVPWKPEEDEIMKYFSAIHSPMPADIRLRACAMWATSIAATVFEPERKGQIMLILQGPGGIGKSFYALLIIPKCHPAGTKLYTSITQEEIEGRGDTRGFYLKLGSNLIGLVEEYSYASQKSRDFLKNVVTSTFNQQRVLYDSACEHLERVCALYATTNEEFLMSKEMAEMRRFLVIPVTAIDNNGRFELDDVMFYGQAAWLYRHGMKYWFEAGNPGAFEKALFNHAEKFAAGTPEEELIERYLFAPNETPVHPESGEQLPLVPMMVSDVLNELAVLAPAVARNISLPNLGKALKHAGYTNKILRGRTLYYVCIKTLKILQIEREQAEKDYYNKNKTFSDEVA